ncbi:Outer membrane protein beta-barrel domain-containing protein [Flavobacteriaceae bacterium MAR_2010_188]|nr:Outer membrane protein beta-barrel domain-containing protein [Flavobacteriaceae bacterium MAR_2010_188]
MNKLKLLLALCLFSTIFCNSQELTIGIKGGVNYSFIGDINSRGGSLSGFPVDEVFTPNKELGTQFGGLVMVRFGSLMLRGEILFSKQKNYYEFPSRNSYWNSSRTEIPLIIGYEVFKPFSPYVGINATSTSKLTIDGLENDLTYDKRDLNPIIGLLVDFGRFGVDVRYELSTTEEPYFDANFVNNSTQGQPGYGINSADIYPYKLGVLSLSAHINLFTTDKDRMGSFFGGLFKGDKCYCPYDN